MTFRDQIKLAHEMSATLEFGRWKFKSAADAATFRRKVAGLEWTDEQRKAADFALGVRRAELWTQNVRAG